MKSRVNGIFILLAYLMLALVQCENEPEVQFEYVKVNELHGNVAIADINGDLKNDIVRLSTLRIETERKNLTWFEYMQHNEMEKHVVLEGEPLIGNRLASGDLDNDGDIDLAAGVEEEENRLIWLENPLPDVNPSETNSWVMHSMNPWTGALKDLLLIDFNNDDKLDVVARSHEHTVVFIQETPLAWNALTTLQHASHEGMDVGDLDLDGDPDIILNGFWYETPENIESNTFEYHVIDEQWFTQTEGSWRDNNSSIKVADITNDGLPDILLSHSEKPGYPISIYTAASISDVRNDTWKEIQVIEKFDFCQSLDAADVDNDGDLDILAGKFQRNPDEGEQWMNEPPYPVIIFYNEDGHGTSWRKHNLSTDGLYAGIFGDVGSDGDQDIVGSQSYWTGPIQFWQNLISN